MATNIQELCEELEDILICPLCLEKCTQPKGLPCLHTFCFDCLKEDVAKHEEGYKCPSCKMVVVVPPDGVQGFPGAFLWTTIEETLEKIRVTAAATGIDDGTQNQSAAGNTASATQSPSQLTVRKVGQFKAPYQPRNISCTYFNDIIVCENYGSRVDVYEPDGEGSRMLQMPAGTQITDVHYTIVYVDSILVADKKTASILNFKTDGSFIKSVPVGFQGYAGICVKDEKLFVTSFGNNTVYKMDWPSGENKEVFVEKTSEIDLRGPEFMAASTDETVNIIAVSCHGNKTIFVFNMSGQIQFTYNGQGSPQRSLGLPWGVVIDSLGRLLVSDYVNDSVHIVSSQGEYLGLIDLQKDDLTYPAGLALNSQGHLVVSASGSEIVTYEYLLYNPPIRHD